MKRRKNMMAKVVAFVALFAIVVGVIGTGLLVVVSSPGDEAQITQEQLQEYIDSLSGSVVSGSGDLEDTQTASGEIQ